jgi:P27 family predicted phage terminase small subunit
MKRGRRPKPTTLHRLHRTLRTRHADRIEPLAPGELALEEPPAHLTEAQKARWRWALDRAPRNVLRTVDREALTAFCIAGDLVQQANVAQQALDIGKVLPFLTKSDKGRPTLSPYVRLMLRALPMLLRAAAECGFTPASRAGMSIDQSASVTKRTVWTEFDELKEAALAEDLLAAKPASPQPQ